MSKLKIIRKAKTIRFTYQVLNIKLISNHREGINTYKRILEDLFSQTVIAPIGHGKKAFIKSMFPFEVDGKSFFWGKILKFTDLENRNDWINIITKERESLDINPNIFPDPKEAEFVFIPQAHRFALRISEDFTIQNAYHYFQNAISKVIDNDEDYTVHIQQSKDIFQEIFDAVSVEKLYLSISYTNSDDIGDDMSEWIDSQLRGSNSKEATMSFEAGKNESIDVKVPLIEGSLKLASENGEAEAKILNRSGLKKKVITRNYPEKNRANAPSEDDVKNVIFTQIMDRYRNDGAGKTTD